MSFVWTLYHVHEFEVGHEDVKLIGIFSSEELAVRAKESILDQPGFRDLPDGFSIDSHAVDDVGWRKGFVTIQPGEEF